MRLCWRQLVWRLAVERRTVESVGRCCPEALTVYTADHGFWLGNRGGLYDRGPACYEEITDTPALNEPIVP